MPKASLLIGPIGQLVTAKDTPWRAGDEVVIMENAGIAINGDEVVDVGPWGEVSSKYWSDCVINAEDLLVTPGLVDPHTHALFAGSREDELEMKLQGLTYDEILRRGGGIYRTINDTVKASNEELTKLLMGRLRTALSHGTTTMEVKSGYGLLPREELRLLRVINEVSRNSQVDVVPTYLVHVPPREGDRGEYLRGVVGSLRDAVGLARFVDVFCDAGAFTVEESREVFREASRLGFGLRIHADEISYIGCSDLVVEFNFSSMDHLLNIPERNVNLMASRNVVATLLPITIMSLTTSKRPPVKLMRELRVPMAIGTDFSPNSWSLNMQYAIELATYILGMTPLESLMAATANSAYSLRLSDRGLIRRGSRADVVVWGVRNYRWLTYELGINKAGIVIKGGNIVSIPNGDLRDRIICKRTLS
ncbi:imidazolonepropionase [Vulcanisaeta thermophila]|uniref:imidazolonepropionase n=1 Tax=Vulcanisaeta thermophila TaxID=867917 RepID=UPI000A05A7D2|nr:imidazolonepropionase [Vulcanisaeta thermophila]